MPPEPVRYVAFMRAINVGKRRVKMAVLAEHVESLGFADVRTVIASGNVAFTDPLGRPVDQVQARFDNGLTELLGFDIVSALRTAEHIAAIIAAEPFGSPNDPASDWTEEDVVHISFLLDDAPVEARDRLAELDSPDDRFAIIGTELYWRRRGKLTASVVEPKALTSALGVEATARRLDTVVKMVTLFD